MASVVYFVMYLQGMNHSHDDICYHTNYVNNTFSSEVVPSGQLKLIMWSIIAPIGVVEWYDISAIHRSRVFSVATFQLNQLVFLTQSGR